MPELKLFGRFELTHGSLQLDACTVQHAKWILARCALRPGQVFFLGSLAMDIWPVQVNQDGKEGGQRIDEQEERRLACGRVVRAINYLRAGIDKQLELDPATIIDRKTRGQVRVIDGSLRTDVVEFVEFIKSSKLARSREIEMTRLEAAIELYCGHLLPNVNLTWVNKERKQLWDLYVGALTKVGEFLGERSLWDRASELLAKAIEIEPTHEIPHLLLARLLVRQEKYEDALAECQGTISDLEKRSIKGNGRLKPLQELAAKISESLATGTTFDLSPLVKEGSPRTVLLAPGPQKPTVEAQTRRVRLLPDDMTPIRGRQDEVERLRRILEKERLLALTGPAGIGKTRLGLALARSVAEDFGIVLFLDLASATSPNQIGDFIVRGIDEAAAPGLDSVSRAIQVLNKRSALIVLDCFDEFADSGIALVEGLLKGCPNLRCVITSRRELRIDHHHHPVGPLPLPNQGDTLEVLRNNPSMEVFLYKARIADPEFELKDSIANSIVSVCRALLGIPLAIELAAGRVEQLLKVGGIDKLEGQRFFELLTNGVYGSDPRHHTLRGAINWSWRTLSREEQLALSGLSIFRDGWTRCAAKKVCDVDIETLDRLSRHSLIVKESVDPKDPFRGRFHMNEIIRRFAAENLAQRTGSKLRKRQRKFYALVIGKASSAFLVQESAAWLSALEKDLTNLSQALDMIREDDPKEGLELTYKLAFFYYARGRWGEGLERLDALLNTSIDVEPRVRAAGLCAAGNLAQKLHRFHVAEARFQESIDIARAHALNGMLAFGLNNLGLLCKDLERFEDGIGYFEESLHLKRELGDRSRIGVTLANIGNLYHMMENWEEARRYLLDAVPVLETDGPMDVFANALSNLGGVLIALGDYSNARVALSRAIEIRKDADDLSGLGYAVEEVARFAEQHSNVETATQLLASVRILRDSELLPLTPVEQKRQDSLYERLCGGAHAAIFRQHWKIGANLSMDEAVNLSLRVLASA